MLAANSVNTFDLHRWPFLYSVHTGVLSNFPLTGARNHEFPFFFFLSGVMLLTRRADHLLVQQM